MNEKDKDYRVCIELALNNAKKRMRFLEALDKESIKQEYREWISEEFRYQSILLLREDPII